MACEFCARHGLQEVSLQGENFLMIAVQWTSSCNCFYSMYICLIIQNLNKSGPKEIR